MTKSAILVPMSRFDVICDSPGCDHPFIEHYCNGLGYVRAGPCKDRTCKCPKYQPPPKRLEITVGNRAGSVY